jgi:hypothetical protein
VKRKKPLFGALAFEIFGWLFDLIKLKNQDMSITAQVADLHWEVEVSTSRFA